MTRASNGLWTGWPRRLLPLLPTIAVLLLGIGTGSGAPEGTPVSGASKDPVRMAAKAFSVPRRCVVLVYGEQQTEELGPPVAVPKATVTVLINFMAFSPCGVVVPADTPVTLTLKNLDKRFHGNFVIDELGIRSGNIAPGEALDVTIEAPPGTYVFYSSYAGHRQAGRAGILVVVDQGSALEGTPPAATPSAATPIT